MKIVFVETPSPWLVRSDAIISLGMLYLATVLHNAGYDAQLARPHAVEDFKEFYDADVICLGGTTLEYPMTIKCAKWVREHLPKAKLLFGGTHATAMLQDVLDEDLFDAVCAGEGESIIVEIINDIENGCLRKVYRAGEYIKDLDTIPFPDRSLVKDAYGKGLFSHGEEYIGDKSESLMTSRGCPFNCAFCASKSMWHWGVRYRSANNVADEVEYIIDTMGIKQFGMWDDNLTANKRRCFELCDRLAEYDIAWKGLARAADLTPEICEALARAHCKEVGLGFESGDQRVLDFLDKHTTTEIMATGCKNAKAAGLKVRGLFMIGTPGERADTPELNMEYMNELDPDMVSLSLFTPLPGSPIWNDPDKYNCEILTKDFTKYNEYCYVMDDGKKVRQDFEPLIHNKFLTIDQMQDNIRRMMDYHESAERCNRG